MTNISGESGGVDAFVARMRTLAESAPTPIILLDRGSISYLNPAAEALCGQASAQLAGRGFSSIFIPAEQPTVEELLAGLQRGMPVLATRTVIQRPDGTRCDVAFSVAPCRQDDEIALYSAVVQEVARDDRRNQFTLSNEVEALRLLAQNISEVLYVRNAQRMLYVSPVYEKIWGRPLEEIYRDRLAFINAIHPEDRQLVIGSVNAQREGVPFDREYRIVRPDGTLRWIRARSFLMHDSAGELSLVGGIAEDITDRKLAEERRLTQELELRRTLIREVHHRIKNNLQGVMGLLRQHILWHPEAEPALLAALSHVHTIALVHGLQGQHYREVRLCELTELIVRSVRELHSAAPDPKLDTCVVRPIQLSEQEAVPIALVINELVFNAFKHAPSPARDAVRVRVETVEAGARLEIHTPQARLPAGFDLAHGLGLGTGLSLVKSLLPRAGAVLRAEQRPDGVCMVLEIGPPVVMADALACQEDCSIR